MRLLFKYTSRSRPQRFLEGLKNITDLVNEHINYTILCSLDDDDPSMNNIEMREEISRFRNTFAVYGLSKSKIDAINRDVDKVDKWDILVCMSDDMRFTAHGFDQLIREGFQHNCPDLDGFLHYPDTTAKNSLCTMSIIGRKYYERDKYIYNPAYLSLFADNEAMEVAKMRGKYWYMGLPILDHLHPAYGLAPWDDQYHQQQNLWPVDEAVFNERKKNNFYEPIIVSPDTNDKHASRRI